MNKPFFFAVIATAMLFTNCKKEENKSEVPGGKGKYLVETTVTNPDGASGTSYLQLVSEISGTINNSKAIQIDFSGTTVVIGNDIFSFPTFGKDATMAIRKFTYHPSKQTLSSAVRLELKSPTGPQNISVISSEKAYVPQYISGKVMIINPTTMKQTGEIDLTSYAHSDGSAEPAFGIVRGNYYYLPLNQVNAQFMPYSDHLQADVAVIDIKTDKVVKVISETTSKLSFPTRPMLKDMIFMDENKDIYIACVGYFGFNPNVLQSGFVCIPNGKTEFDVSKSWDISNTTIEGTSYKPASVMNTLYIGGGKLVAYVAIPELSGGDAYMGKYNMAVVINLTNRTIQSIKDIPLSNGHGISIQPYNGIIGIGAEGKEKAGFFTYNPTTGEVKHIANTDGAVNLMHEFK